MYDISGLETLEVTNKSIYNNKFMAHASTLLMETVVNLPDMKDFRKLKSNEQQEVLKEIVKKNKREVTNEIERLLKINVRFVNTQYFHDLARILRIYTELIE